MGVLILRHRVVVESIHEFADGSYDPHNRDAAGMTRTLTLWFDYQPDAVRCYERTPIPGAGVTVTLESESAPERWVVKQSKRFDMIEPDRVTY